MKRILGLSMATAMLFGAMAFTANAQQTDPATPTNQTTDMTMAKTKKRGKHHRFHLHRHHKKMAKATKSSMKSSTKSSMKGDTMTGTAKPNQ